MSTFDFSIYFTSPPSESNEYLKRAYWYSIDNFNYENAIFLAQLISTYETNKQESKYLLALAHFYLGHHSLVVDILKGCMQIHSLYLLSKSYIQLRNFSISERCLNQLFLLLKNEIHDSKIGNPEVHRITKPDLASCLYLQGLTYRGLGKFEEASKKFKEAIYHNCLIWCSFENLCQIDPPDESFLHSSFSIKQITAKFCLPANQSEDGTFNQSKNANTDPFNASKSNFESSALFPRSANKPLSTTPSKSEKMKITNKRLAALSVKTPLNRISSLNSIRSKSNAAPVKSRLETRAASKPQTANERNSNSHSTRSHANTNTANGQQAPSTSKSQYTQKKDPASIHESDQDENKDETSQNNLHSKNNIAHDESPLHEPEIISPDSKSMEFIHNLFIKLAIGYAELQNYSSQDAIKTFSSLQCPKFTNPWIQTQISKAYMDLGQNIQAEEILSQSIRKYPLFLDSMDIYSSILWQLGKNDELYELANNLADRHKKLPQAWCAMGNYFNSQQDHIRALKCFKRATLLDNRYALAYNLAGHEYIDIKETQLALQCFQTAVNINPRFYQAWFNIARIYLFSGKNELALAHLAKAISINPKHPILLQYVAECRARLQHFEEALHALQLATPMDPSNVMIRYKKARLLAKLGNLQAAKHELDIIAQNCTEGSDVYFTLAKICTIHGDHSQANLYFQEAIRQNPEIAPKVNRIQECINKDEPINWEDDDDDI